ncbi:MAG TPA: phosphotransferase [Gammaproteobacteria bacterium]|nr:phosphotransferase [Gammaproteobacteria bacterium]
MRSARKAASVNQQEVVTGQGLRIIAKLKQNLINVTDEDAGKILHLSQKRLNRLSLLVNNLLQHKLLDQESFEKTLSLVSLKLPAVNESAHTKVNLQKGKKVTLDSGVTVFFKNQKNIIEDFSGSYGKVIRGYAKPDDREPTWAVKKLFRTKSPKAIKNARREVKYLRHAGINAFFYTTKYSVKIVMDWQNGLTLEDLVKSTEFESYSFARKLKILSALFSELLPLNDILRVHGDVHDGNVMVDGDKVVLIDYGQAGSAFKLKPDDQLYKDNDKIIDYVIRKQYGLFFKREWEDLARVEGMAAKLLHDAMRTCSIAQAHAYCKMLLANLDGLNHAKLHEIAKVTINRSNLTVDDVLHGSERPLTFARK